MTRTRLFADEPVAELRGLSSLTDPDRAGGVIDVAVFGARGDGKTQFIVHAIRTLRAHAPTLSEPERGLNREVLRVVLDPRAPRPEATPPGFVPHYTFRVRPRSLLARLRWLPTLRLLWRASATAVSLAAVAFVAAIAAIAALGSAPSLAVAGLGLGLLAATALSARMAVHRLRHVDELEVAFWDIAGEHVYSASAADYYSLLASLIGERKRRAAELGRAYAFAPVLLCNPIALGTTSAGSPFERLRQLLPLFAAIDDQSGRALIAVNRWSVVDPICARGQLRDEIVEVTARAHGEDSAAMREVARDVVRRHCLDSEDGRDGDVMISYLRYDTALRCSIDASDASDGSDGSDGSDASDASDGSDGKRASLTYCYDEGPGAFTGEAGSQFLDWLLRGLRRPVVERSAGQLRPAEYGDDERSTTAHPPVLAAESAAANATEIWARPADSSRAPNGSRGGAY
jgi:hypothetical protein